MPIQACPECLSDRLSFPKDANPFTCYACGWAGKPTEYRNFAAWQEARSKNPRLALTA